jgi:hypothetical protein
MNTVSAKALMGLAGLGLALTLAGCGNGANLSSDDLGKDWPFTVSKVRVVCGPTMSLFVTADGKAYPLNGQAERHPELYTKAKLDKLNDIWKVDPVISQLSPDTRMSLNAVTDKAIAACAKAGKWDMAKG